MARRNSTQIVYQAIRIEGALIPADELARLTALQDPERTEQTDSHYGVPKGLKLRDEIARYWKIAQNLWFDLQPLRVRQDVDAHAVTQREFLVPLLRDVLGFTDIAAKTAIEAGGRVYKVGHAAHGGRLPVVLAAHSQGLDEPAERFGEVNPESGRVRRRSPFMLAQEALNATDRSLWAVASNGLKLRILRDNPSLTRPAYVEVDLEAIFSEDLYADFTACWLLAHASRFGNANSDPGDCPWERWRASGQEAGVAVRTNLRFQVAEALRVLGTGFVSHPANSALRAALQNTTDNRYDKQQFFEELLRLVYRLIFLATVEDRRDEATDARLIFSPDATSEARQRYLAGYSLAWLRERAARRSQYDRHSDLWQALSITFGALARGEPLLGLPALGGLFDTDQCPWLDAAQLENHHLLAAVFQLGWFRGPGGLTRVNYRDMGPEELGSVYESLLELVPDLQGLANPAHARLAFVGDDDTGASTRGNARKLTGSYYTPDSLVQELIKSALEPVLVETVKANPQRPVEALLELTICDPACGSGHFLLSAARRLADEVALYRAAVEREGGSPTPADYRHALRDVVSRCIFGVDKNPMAIQLAKTALWLEAYSPDRPLSFVDHHLQVGDALLGVLDPKVLENGIPDEAYNALSGDDKTVASALRKQNKADLKSWKAIAAGDLFTKAGLVTLAVAVETLTDDTPARITAKRTAWLGARDAAQHSTLARLADTYVAAFLAPKLAGSVATVPVSGYLWGVLNGQPADPAKEVAAQTLCDTHRVFHWWLTFPQVAARGGFSVMLGNPPWERIKLQEEEFFATRSPLVATARNKAERGQRIEWLREGVLMHHLNPDIEAAEGLSPPNRAEVALYEEFIATRRGAEAASLYFHDGRRFPLTGVGDVNTYALFAETFLQATSHGGRSGFIVPTGIATDDSTKAYFGHIASSGRLACLYDFENREGVFPAIDSRIKFSLLTLGGAQAAEFVCFATQVAHLTDARRRFTLTPEDFTLINPNTRTCPVFRSERDAELTKKLYRAAPVLIKEAVADSEGRIVEPEVNPWGIQFMRMLDMSNDSGMFHDQPNAPGSPKRLPLYEAKMVHQFDHRWATYVDTPGSTTGSGEVETIDVNEDQKADPGFTVQPRYWVDEREVLARIARVPARVARTWLALHLAMPERSDGALADLLLALAAWVAGELLTRAPGASAVTANTVSQGSLAYVAAVENPLRESFAPLSNALLASGMTTRKALTEYPKWAAQNIDARLTDAELTELGTALRSSARREALLSLLDAWMDSHSPRWLMGWRDICRSTDERTVIASVVPRVGIGHKMPLFHVHSDIDNALSAGLLANFNALVLDYVARQKVGGTSLTYHYLKQFCLLPPGRYSSQTLAFVVPRVLELTYTTHGIREWADHLVAYDTRNPADCRRPFGWDANRRARVRAELDAYYARLYSLTRDELRYILDPVDAMGASYPSETFRVLKNNEIRIYGEYRTRRLVLEAWDSTE